MVFSVSDLARRGQVTETMMAAREEGMKKILRQLLIGVGFLHSAGMSSGFSCAAGLITRLRCRPPRHQA